MTEITWIKLKTDMFENQKIKLIEALPEADTILVIWLKLLATAGKVNCNGYIMITESIPMNIEEMATVFNRPLNTVRLALETFKRYGMIEMDDDQVVRITNWEKHQSVDKMNEIREYNRIAKRKSREKKKQLPNVNDKSMTSQQCHDTDKEQELEEDKDIDKDIKKQHLVDDDFLKLINFYQQNIGQIAPILSEKLGDLVDTHNIHLIIEAFTRAITAQASNKFKYADKILKSWKEKNILTIKDLKASEVKPSAKPSRSKAEHHPIDDLF